MQNRKVHLYTGGINIAGFPLLKLHSCQPRKVFSTSHYSLYFWKTTFKAPDFRIFQQEKWSSTESSLSWLYHPQYCAILCFIPRETVLEHLRVVLYLKGLMYPQWPVAATLSTHTTRTAITQWHAIPQHTALSQIRAEIGLFMGAWLVDPINILYRGCRQDIVMVWPLPMVWNSNRAHAKRATMQYRTLIWVECSKVAL